MWQDEDTFLMKGFAVFALCLSGVGLMSAYDPIPLMPPSLLFLQAKLWGIAGGLAGILGFLAPPLKSYVDDRKRQAKINSLDNPYLREINQLRSQIKADKDLLARTESNIGQLIHRFGTPPQNLNRMAKFLKASIQGKESRLSEAERASLHLRPASDPTSEEALMRPVSSSSKPEDEFLV